MPGALTPSYFNWNYTMPSLGPNGELTGSPVPIPDNYDPSKGVDIRNPDGTFTHMDAHKDRNGNYINPTVFMSDSLPGGVAYAYPDTDEYAHIGRVFRTDRNRAIGKMLALVGGGALAGGLGAAGGNAGAVGDLGSEGYGISQGFLSPATEAAMQGSGALAGAAPLGADVMTVTAPALAGGLGGLGTAAGVTAGAGALSGLGGGDFWTPEGGSGELPEQPPSGDTGSGYSADPATGQPSGGSFMDKLKGVGKKAFVNPDGSYNWPNILKAGSTGLGMLGSLTGADRGGGSPGGLPAEYTQHAIPMAYNREQTAPMTNYTNYGKAGQGNEAEHQFFTPGTFTTKAGGGGVRGPGSGREDKIDALLSDGEYVFDAESVALLGDGSLDEGARRLDQLRQNVRRHKGAALAKGKFTPAAKSPEEYIGKAKGGKIRATLGALGRLIDPPPPPTPKMQVSPEELAQMVAWLRAHDPNSDVLKHFDAAQTPDLRGRVPASLSPPQVMQTLEPHAKGGRIRGDWVRAVIKGGLSDEDRLAKLQEALKVESILKQGEEIAPDTPTVAAQQQAQALQEARDRVAKIRAMIKPVPDAPVQKAKGGPVGELTELANHFQEALDTGNKARVAQIQSQLDSSAVPPIVVQE